ncbi:MAG TPA: hypothetical protein VMF67_04555 [Rhizomicrobium sp.]|nr:hypothetical protein [Rhizomicrobium sp.]
MRSVPRPFTHRFVTGPGDGEYLSWHYVEAGAGEPIVFLHGIPDSWYQCIRKWRPWPPNIDASPST